MKKLVLIVSLALLFAGVPLQPAYAACPGFTTSPSLTGYQGDQPVTFSVNTAGFGKSGGYYMFKFQQFGSVDTFKTVANTGSSASVTLPATDGALRPATEARYFELYWSQNNFRGPTDQLMCTDFFQVTQEEAGNCSITINPSGPSIKDKITATATNNTGEVLHIQYDPPNAARGNVANSDIEPGKTKTVVLANNGVGTYDVTLENPLQQNKCSTQFVVSTQGGATADPKIGKVCDVVDVTSRSACHTCFTGGGAWTAIGCIPTTPSGFIQKFMGLGVGIAGGIAFLLILFSGFQILTSVGNPEKLAAGRELMTAAISGLLLIILSLFLLRLIGFSILGIPGFK